MPTLDQTVPVTEAQRRQWDVDGYFITDVLFDEATLEGVRSEFQRLWNEEIAAADKLGNQDRIHWAKVRLFTANLDQRSEICKAFCHHPVFADLSRQFLGSDADLIWNQAIVKAPMSEKEAAGAKQNAFGWHQDIYYALNGGTKDEYNEGPLRNPDNEITCWVAISRTIVDNGTLWVLPGRHTEGLLPHVWNTERNEFQGQFDTSWKIPVVMRAGQALVFRKYLPHSSGINISNEPRLAYQISFGIPGINKTTTKNFAPLIRNGELV